jgi:hypothetical protein
VFESDIDQTANVSAPRKNKSMDARDPVREGHRSTAAPFGASLAEHGARGVRNTDQKMLFSNGSISTHIAHEDKSHGITLAEDMKRH